MKNLIIASTSTIHNESYLDYLLPELKIHFKNCKNLIFIPFARPSGITHEDYTQKVGDFFAKIDISVKGLHEFEDKKNALETAECIFTGGGNTFLLVTQLYKHKVMQVLTEVLNNGTPYLGTSAGNNICGLSMQTTNDMPIIYPPSFQTLGVVPFNLNPHYIDADLNSKHMGETRETRINEFHTINNIPVVGLREGSWIEVKNYKTYLRGNLTARIFLSNKEPFELESNSEIIL